MSNSEIKIHFKMHVIHRATLHKHKVLFTEDDIHRVIFTMDDCITLTLLRVFSELRFNPQISVIQPKAQTKECSENSAGVGFATV